MLLHQIRLNFGGGIRTEMFLGEEHFVLDATAIRQGVWTGLDGTPVFYANEELAPAAPTYNHLPIVLRHPDPAGPTRGSAHDPDELNARGVGLILNARHEGDETKFQLYVNKRRVLELDEDFYSVIEKGDGIEGSVGVLSADDPTPGAFGDKEYKVRAHSMRGDHFALLPDGTGACSRAAGCGIAPRLNAAGEKCKCDGKCDDCKHDHQIEDWNKTRTPDQRKQLAKSGAALSDGTFPVESEEDLRLALQAYPRANNKAAVKKHLETRARQLGKPDLLPADWVAAPVLRLNNRVQLNEQSLSDRISQVREALYSKFSKPGYSWNGYVEDVYQDFVVYCLYDYSKSYPDSNEIYKIGYRMDGDKVVLIGEPVEVDREVSYVTANGAHLIANAAGRFFSQTEVRLMDRKQKIDRLISNGAFEEADREYLDKKTDPQLDKLVGKLSPETTPAPPPAVTQNTAPPVKPATTTDPRAYINGMDAPAPIKTMLLNGLEVSLARKGEIITALMAHPANKFTKEFLETKELPELEGIAALLPQDGTVHQNSGGIRMFQQGTSFIGAQGVGMHQNSGEPDATIGLGLPSEAEYDAAHKV